MVINFNDPLIQAYVKTLKSEKFLHAKTNSLTPYSENYNKIINIVKPTVTDRRTNASRLLVYYTNRLSQVERVLAAIDTTNIDNDLELEFEAFNNFTIANAGLSTSMDNLAGLLKYSVDFTMVKLRELRREQKVLIKTIADISSLVDEYTNLESLFDQATGALV